MQFLEKRFLRKSMKTYAFWMILALQRNPKSIRKWPTFQTPLFSALKVFSTSLLFHTFQQEGCFLEFSCFFHACADSPPLRSRNDIKNDQKVKGLPRGSKRVLGEHRFRTVFQPRGSSKLQKVKTCNFWSRPSDFLKTAFSHGKYASICTSEPPKAAHGTL